jgi:radical SAM protein with 4Fe4S-binding SPASM domain
MTGVCAFRPAGVDVNRSLPTATMVVFGETGGRPQCHGSVSTAFADLNANELAYSAIEELKANAAESGVHLQLMTPERISVETGPERQGLNVFFGDAHANNAIESRSRVCMLPWESAHIDASGSVFPCCSASAKNEGKLGDLTKTSLDEIWNGPAYQEFRSRLLLTDGRSCPDVCAKCTIAAIGTHPANDFAAQIVSLSVTGNTVELAVQNKGRVSWSAAGRPWIGTAGPRNRSSLQADTSWISPQRAAVPREDVVQPGELAHFEFTLAQPGSPSREAFELVVDGVLWMPNTRFVVVLKT